jgi:hypothetical protein
MRTSYGVDVNNEHLLQLMGGFVRVAYDLMWTKLALINLCIVYINLTMPIWLNYIAKKDLNSF